MFDDVYIRSPIAIRTVKNKIPVDASKQSVMVRKILRIHLARFIASRNITPHPYMRGFFGPSLSEGSRRTAGVEGSLPPVRIDVQLVVGRDKGCWKVR